MNTTPKISVIVPIYNVEKYIERCVSSLFQQTLDEIEYIFVDDCSPDRSIDILHEMIQQYPNREKWVKIVRHERNQGLTSARNSGISIATGEYIAHCDSDDWVDVDMYNNLYIQASETKSDIVYSDFYFVYDNKIDIYNSASYSIDKKELLKNYIASVWTSLVNMIVKRSVYESNNLKSPEHLCYCEDFWLSVRLFHYSRKITKICKPFYYYNQCNNNSIMHNLHNYSGDDMRCYLETVELFSKEGCLGDYEKVLSWRILNAFHLDIYDPSKHEKIVLTYPKSHKYILSCPYYSKKQKILTWLLTHHCRFIVLLFLKLKNILRGTN